MEFEEEHHSPAAEAVALGIQFSRWGNEVNAILGNISLCWWAESARGRRRGRERDSRTGGEERDGQRDRWSSERRLKWITKI